MIFDLDPSDARAYLDMAMGHIQKKMYRRPCRTQRRASPCLGAIPSFFLSLPLFTAAGADGTSGQAVEEMQAASKKSFVAPFLFATAFVGWARRKGDGRFGKRVTKLTIRTW